MCATNQITLDLANVLLQRASLSLSAQRSVSDCTQYIFAVPVGRGSTLCAELPTASHPHRFVYTRPPHRAHAYVRAKLTYVAGATDLAQRRTDVPAWASLTYSTPAVRMPVKRTGRTRNRKSRRAPGIWIIHSMPSRICTLGTVILQPWKHPVTHTVCIRCQPCAR